MIRVGPSLFQDQNESTSILNRKEIQKCLNKFRLTVENNAETHRQNYWNNCWVRLQHDNINDFQIKTLLRLFQQILQINRYKHCSVVIFLKRLNISFLMTLKWFITCDGFCRLWMKPQRYMYLSLLLRQINQLNLWIRHCEWVLLLDSDQNRPIRACLMQCTLTLTFGPISCLMQCHETSCLRRWFWAKNFHISSNENRSDFLWSQSSISLWKCTVIL